MNLFATLPNRTAAAPRISSTRQRPAQSWIARAKAAIWRSLEQSGRARARRELHLLANRYSIDQPELAKEIRAAANYNPTA